MVVVRCIPVGVDPVDETGIRKFGRDIQPLDPNAVSGAMGLGPGRPGIGGQAERLFFLVIGPEAGAAGQDECQNR